MRLENLKQTQIITEYSTEKHIQVQNYTFLKKKNSHKSESVALKYTNVKVAS